MPTSAERQSMFRRCSGRRAVLDSVFEFIATAARSGAPSPTFTQMVAALEDEGGLPMNNSTLPSYIDVLEAEGRLTRGGTHHKRIYTLSTGEATIPSRRHLEGPGARGGKPRHPPTLKERLAMWGLTEPFVHPPRPFRSQRMDSGPAETMSAASSLIQAINS
jgi:hypothetical protein